MMHRTQMQHISWHSLNVRQLRLVTSQESYQGPIYALPVLRVG